MITHSEMLDKTIERRSVEIGTELERQLDMQFGISKVGGGDRVNLMLKQIEELIEAAPRTRDPKKAKPIPTAEDSLAEVIARTFPFITQQKAISLIRRDVAFDELVSLINFEAGAK